MRRILLTASLGLLMGFSLHAQTVKWVVEPKYNSIDYYSSDIFQCADQYGKLQLLDKDGRALLPDNIAADALTEYNDGDEYVIVLKGSKILGFLTESKPYTFQPVIGEYYITDYPFFSEDFLVVADAKGKQGYMDTRGQIVIDCKYEKARPFRQGRASVEPAKKQVYYINPQGKTNNPDSFHGGKLTKGSSFNGAGEAVVANYQDYAVINTKMQVVRKIKYTSELPVCPLDYSYDELGGDCMPKTGFMAATWDYTDEDNHCESFSERGANGYQYKLGDEVIVIPAQFSDASPFMQGRAIVGMGGKFGIIELVKGKFVPAWPVAKLRAFPDGAEETQFALAVPVSLQSDKVKLELDKGDGRYTECNGLHSYFMIPNQMIDHKEKSCTLKARAKYTDNGPELLLWEGSYQLGIDYISVGLSNPSVTSEYADENDNQTVKAVVTNTSDVTVTISATLTVGKTTRTQKWELKPKESKTLTASVKVDEDKQVKATVSATVEGHDCGSKSSTVSLKKI